MRALGQALLGSPARVAAVAGATLTQLLRMRLFLVPAAVALLVLLLQFVPYQEGVCVEFQGVAQLLFLKDVCLGCMQLFALLFCVAATALLIPRDAEDRILYTILCKPVPRFDYLLGKWLGVVALLLLVVGLLDGLMVLLLELRGASLAASLREQLTLAGYSPEQAAPYLEQVAEAGNTWNVQRGILASLLGYGVLTGLTLLISCCTSGSLVSMMFGLGAYAVGMSQGTLLALLSAGQGVSASLQVVQRAVQFLLPDFSLFAVADAAAAGTPLSWGMLGALALLAFFYILLHLSVAALIFSRKEF